MMLTNQNTSISSITIIDHFSMFEVFRNNNAGNDQENNDLPFNVAFNIIDDETGTSPPGIKRFGRFVVTEYITNLVD